MEYGQFIKEITAVWDNEAPTLLSHQLNQTKSTT